MSPEKQKRKPEEEIREMQQKTKMEDADHERVPCTLVGLKTKGVRCQETGDDRALTSRN